jgi:ABC-type multidrug transport system ATPase subunit
MDLREPTAATAGPGAEAGDGGAQPPAQEVKLEWRELGRRVALMRSAPLLRGMSWELLATLAPVLRRETAGPGTALYRQGEPAVRFYLIETGRVLRLRAGEGGAQTEELGPGDTCGDAVLWAGPTYRATARAESPLTLWALDAGELGTLREGHPTLDAALRACRPGSEAPAEVKREHGVRVNVRGLGKSVGDGKKVLHSVRFSVEPGELLAIVGGSGAGKSTLLDAIAGVRPADEGTVLFDGVPYYEHLEEYRSALGYVPQDDIIHAELSLIATLRYAARLRLPDGTSPGERESAVADVMDALDLTQRAELRIGSLSGGQRKRASIAVELLTKPHVFFLDEPTSGLDPATAAELLRLLRRLADSGRTVVLTTHSMQDLAICDKLVVLARDGHCAFVGAPEAAVDHFQVGHDEMYERLAGEATPAEWARRFSEVPEQPDESDDAQQAARAAGPLRPPGAHPIGPLRQCAVLSRRNLDILVHNRLTLAILLGSPVLVVLMFVVLFKPGAFDFADPSPSATIMIAYWVAFGGFFFGLTYGLLQICTEFPILRRERFVGLRVGPYVLSKVVVLAPLLLAMSVIMLVVLRLSDRLPEASLGTYAVLTVTLFLDALAALALGLLTSAAVTGPAQATIALPLLCFPQVLFSGAILAVPIMATIGKAVSYPMTDRWAFEGLGHELGLNRLLGEGGSQLGPPLLAEYGDTFSRGTWIAWTILAGMALVFLIGAVAVCARKCRPAAQFV